MMLDNLVFKNILIEKFPDGITVISINRPKALNALNAETLDELATALALETKNNLTRVLILTGSGDKSFIAGADISEMKGMSSLDGVELSQRGHRVSNLLDQMPKPTIAAVNGYALGGGTEIALACDFIVAADTAVFGLPEVGLGVIPGFGGHIRLAKFVGLPKAKELVFTGKRLNAQEALGLGLVNHVYTKQGFLEEVLKLAQSISKNSMSAIAATKRILNEFSETQGMHFKCDAEAQAFSELFGTADQIEGMNAFLEKRKPNFQGVAAQ